MRGNSPARELLAGRPSPLHARNALRPVRHSRLRSGIILSSQRHGDLPLWAYSNAAVTVVRYHLPRSIATGWKKPYRGYPLPSPSYPSPRRTRRCIVARVNEASLVLIKNLLFNVVCLRREAFYFALKGRLMLAAARAGLYESRYMRLLPDFVEPGSEAVDVGANFGGYTHRLSQLVGPSGRLFAFEPIPFVSAFLEKSCAGLGNVEVFEEALSNSSEEDLELRIPYIAGAVPEPALASVETDTHRRRIWKVVRVRTRRLDDHLASFKRLSFIKADIEGHELEFLHGAAQTIRTFLPVLQIEASAISPKANELRAWCQRLGYEIFNLAGERLRVAAAEEGFSENIYLIAGERCPQLPARLFAC